jgi:hypothetical protein
MKVKISWLVVLFSLLGLTACASQSEQLSFTVPQSFHSQQCFVSQGEAYIWLEQEEHWLELPASIRGQMSHAQVNWIEENVLLVSLGQKPSAGYGIELTNWLIEQDHWQVVRVSHQPAEGSMQAMMMTSPCVLVKIPKRVKSFSLLNEQGQALGRWPY